MRTLLLDQTAWDLVLTSDGNIALADDPYSRAQDAASAIRTFIGECWYDTRIGIPYFQNILGQLPSIQYVQNSVEQAALTVPGIVKAKCTITEFTDRKLSGVVELIDVDGVQNNVEFTQ